MRRKSIKKWVALSLSTAMLASLAACGGGSDTPATTGTTAGTTAGETTTTAGSGETTAASETSGEQAFDKLDLITLYPNDANTSSGNVTGYKGDILAKRGLEMEIWAFSNEKTNAILASGELPDVMYVKYDQFVTMVEAGMVLNLDEHLDKLPHLTGKEQATAALNYTREYKSAGTGALYGIPINIGITEDISRDTGRNAVKVNWDVYYDMGCPEVKTVDDLIPLMKDMMAHKPEADDGTKTWGTILNSGSDDKYWGCMQLWYKWFGYEPENLEYLIESNMIDNTYTSILEAGQDSLYYKGLKWYNTAMREGVMDPDSINNERELGKAKVETSYACMVPSGTLAGWAKYRPIYLEGQHLMQENWSKPYGGDTYVVVNAKTKNVDAALRAVDMLSDNDFRYEVWNGPEGTLWEYDENGKVVPTEYGVETGVSGDDVYFPNNEKRVQWLDNTIFDGTFAETYIGPNGPRQARGLSEWDEVLEIRLNTEEEKQWREAFGYENFNELLKDKGAFTLTSDIFNVSNFCADPDDSQKLILDAIRTVVVDSSWKMVYAKDDAEFESHWNKMIEDCKQLDAETLVSWRMDELNKAMEIKKGLEQN